MNAGVDLSGDYPVSAEPESLYEKYSRQESGEVSAEDEQLLLSGGGQGK